MLHIHIHAYIDICIYILLGWECYCLHKNGPLNWKKLNYVKKHILNNYQFYLQCQQHYDMVSFLFYIFKKLSFKYLQTHSCFDFKYTHILGKCFTIYALYLTFFFFFYGMDFIKSLFMFFFSFTSFIFSIRIFVLK